MFLVDARADGTRVSPPPPPPVSSQPPVQSPPPLINTPPTTTPPAAPSPSPSPQSKTGVIVGAVVGGVAGVGLLAGLVAFFLVRKRRGRRDDVTVSTVAAPPKDTTGTSVVVIGVDGSPNSAPAKSGTPGNSQSPRSDAAAAIVLSDTYTTKTAQGSHVSVYGGQSLTSSGSKQLQKTFSADKSRGQYETRALSSMSGAAPSSMDSYAVYQVGTVTLHVSRLAIDIFVCHNGQLRCVPGRHCDTAHTLLEARYHMSGTVVVLRLVYYARNKQCTVHGQMARGALFYSLHCRGRCCIG